MMKSRWTDHNNNRMTWFDQVLLDGCGILFEINLIQECFNPGVHDIFNWRSWKTVQNVPYAEMNNMQKTSELLIVCIKVDVSLTQQHACIIAGCIVHWKVPNLVMPFQLIYNYKTGHKRTFDVAPTQSRSASIIQANRGPSWLPLIHIKLISVDLNTKRLSESSVIQWAMRARKPALLLANQVSAVNEIQLRAF